MEGKKIDQIDGFFTFDYKYGGFPFFRKKFRVFLWGLRGCSLAGTRVNSVLGAKELGRLRFDRTSHQPPLVNTRPIRSLIKGPFVRVEKLAFVESRKILLPSFGRVF